MSPGRSIRNGISVEPGLPKIVVIPSWRITVKVASRTVSTDFNAWPAPFLRLLVLRLGPSSKATTTYHVRNENNRSHRAPPLMIDQPPRSPDYVQSLARGLAVIRAFDNDHRELGLSEVARASGLTRAAARRFLLTLVKLGYVNFSDGRFSLRPRVLELGYAYLSSLSLPEVAQPHMEVLVAQVNESSSISVLDGIEIVYVARVPTRRIMSITLSVGTRLPAYATSMGRVLLAGLPDEQLRERMARIDVKPLTPRTVKNKPALAKLLENVRRQGYAATDQELEEGLRSLAVPIRNASGDVVAALNLSVHASRASMAVLRRDYLPPALTAAKAIEADLRGAGRA